MRSAAAQVSVLCSMVALAACSGDDAPDAGAPDAQVDAAVARDAGFADAGFADVGPSDAGFADAGPSDAGLVDAGPSDAGVVDAGPEPVGAISGACGELDDELTSPNPSTFVNAIDFPNGYTMDDLDRLSPGGQAIFAAGNEGGSSEESEIFAFEVLHRCEGATLLLTEREVMYDPMMSKKTDLVVEIDGERIGVSVTRAVGFPRDDPWVVSQAVDLLEDKLADVLVSSANVIPGQAWTKQILHVIAYGPMHADSLRAAEAMIDPAVRADTILWITVSNGDDAFLY